MFEVQYSLLVFFFSFTENRQFFESRIVIFCDSIKSKLSQFFWSFRIACFRSRFLLLFTVISRKEEKI